MNDIALNRGDCSVTYQGKDEKGDSTYDLVLETSPQVESKLVKRALETPFSYLSLWSFPLSKIDGEFGNKIYLYLSEVLNFSWISSVTTLTDEALEFVKDYIDILDMKIEAINLNSVEVSIKFRSKNDLKIYNIKSTI